MGLPLFIAPVESDVPLQARRKGGSTSPRRSSIRRLGYSVSRYRETPESRSSRNNSSLTRSEQRRRARVFEYAGTMPSPRPTGRAVAAEFVRNGFLSTEDLTNPELRDNPHRQSMVRNMILLFGEDWQQRDWEHSQRDTNGSWWLVQAAGPGGRPRLVRLDGRTLDSPSSSTRGSPERDSVRVTLNRPTTNRVSQASLPWSPLPPDSDRRTANSDLNGLGDRDRSLSPEVWDTLLTTLTPDPQPPSASSSFASTTGTHTGASFTASARRVMPAHIHQTGPNTFQVLTSDAACESGGENSDDETDPSLDWAQRFRAQLPHPTQLDREGPPPPLEALEMMRMMHRRPRRQLSSRRPNPVRFHVPERNDESREQGDSPRLGTTAATISSATPDRLSHTPEDGPSRRRSDNPNILRFEAPDSRNGWVGQLVIDSSGTNESRATESQLVSTGTSEEGEIADLRRIVRNLAELQDIPDELWASAGIGRTLHREANN